LPPSLLVFAACAPAGEPTDTVGNGGGKEDRADSRPGDILSTTLKVDLATRHANAILEVKPDGDGRLELDVHGLAIKDVTERRTRCATADCSSSACRPPRASASATTSACTTRATGSCHQA
jgi:hypothetical protein